MESDLRLHCLPMSHRKEARQLIKATIEIHYVQVWHMGVI